MYSKVTIAGHPIHPMLIAYPVASYTGTLVGFAVYAANGQQFWLRLAIALNIAGVGMALLAALPGFVDWAFGVPRGSAAKGVGLAHAGLNVAALGLMLVQTYPIGVELSPGQQTDEPAVQQTQPPVRLHRHVA